MADAKANGKNEAAKLAKIPAAANPLVNEPSAIASNISYHVQYSPHFSPTKFEPEQAFFATAESVRDRLIQVKFLSHHVCEVSSFILLIYIYIYNIDNDLQFSYSLLPLLPSLCVYISRYLFIYFMWLDLFGYVMILF